MLALEEDRRLIKEEIERSIQGGYFTEKDVLIFGCTIYTRDIRDVLLENGVRLKAILDNNKKKAGGTCLGVPVYLPESYFQEQDGDAAVIICSKYYREMEEQLHALGCGSMLHIPVTESRRKDDDSLEILQERFADAEEGYRIYLRIQQSYPQNRWLFLCPYPGTGDIYMACVYLDAFLKKEQPGPYVMAVSAESCRKTALLFGVGQIERVSKDEMEKLLKAWEFLGSRKMLVKPLLYWGWRTKRYLYADEYPQITFNEMFLYDVFDLPCGTEKKRIEINGQSGYAEALFKRLGLKPHRTVIMAPYAGSFVPEMGIEAWAEIAADLVKKGWTVATNCSGDAERPVPGTVPIWFPYEEAVQVLEYAGGFVALRSGLCDIVSQAKCKMVILYESGFNAARYEYFSLKKMGLNPDAVEFVYEKKDEDVLKQKIIEAVQQKEILEEPYGVSNYPGI